MLTTSVVGDASSMITPEETEGADQISEKGRRNAGHRPGISRERKVHLSMLYRSLFSMSCSLSRVSLHTKGQ